MNSLKLAGKRPVQEQVLDSLLAEARRKKGIKPKGPEKDPEGEEGQKRIQAKRFGEGSEKVRSKETEYESTPEPYNNINNINTKSTSDTESTLLPAGEVEEEKRHKAKRSGERSGGGGKRSGPIQTKRSGKGPEQGNRI